MDWGTRARARRDVQRGDRRPSLQPEGEHRARRPRDRLPARLDPGLGRQRRGAGRRRPAQLGGALLHEAERRPRPARLRARAPPRDRRPDPRPLRAARHARPAAARHRAARADRDARRRRPRPQPGAAHGERPRRRPRGGGRAPSATTSSTATRPRRDLPRPAARAPATALVADDLERLGVSYSGIFPNHRADGDVLRMQSLHRVRVKADDVAVASDHGRELLDYVLADLERRDRRRSERRPRGRRGGRRPCA